MNLENGKALFKVIIRVVKCNPWFNTGGYDSPKERGKKKWI